MEEEPEETPPITFESPILKEPILKAFQERETPHLTEEEESTLLQRLLQNNPYVPRRLGMTSQKRRLTIVWRRQTV